MRSARIPLRPLLPILAALLASALPAAAMQPAQSKPGYELGVSLGGSVNTGPRFAGAGDVDLGFYTGLLNQSYTSVVADVLTVGRTQNFALPVGRADVRAILTTLGVRQPLPIPGPVPVALEGGLSYLNASVETASGRTTINPIGGFVGVRASVAVNGPVGLTAMFRYHTEGDEFYQTGAGISGPTGVIPGSYYQFDYYHTWGGGIAGFSSNTDTILVGLRWAGDL